MLTPLRPLLRSRAKNQESLGVRVVQRAIRGNFQMWAVRRAGGQGVTLNEAGAAFNATSPEAARKVYVHRVT
jgi:hypothetical protein